MFDRLTAQLSSFCLNSLNLCRWFHDSSLKPPWAKYNRNHFDWIQYKSALDVQWCDQWYFREVRCLHRAPQITIKHDSHSHSLWFRWVWYGKVKKSTTWWQRWTEHMGLIIMNKCAKFPHFLEAHLCSVRKLQVPGACWGWQTRVRESVYTPSHRLAGHEMKPEADPPLLVLSKMTVIHQKMLHCLPWHLSKRKEPTELIAAVP